MSKIERVVRQAQATFCGARTSNDIRDDLAELIRNVNELNVQSVGLDLRLLQWDNYELTVNRDCLRRPFTFSRNSVLHRKVPVTYVHVFKDRNVSIGTFVLREGAEIPLHDHPCMHGLLKVIYGQVKIQSYTLQQKQTYSESSFGHKIIAMRLAPVVVSVTDDPSILYPEEGNIHQVAAKDGPAVFLDILSPPYGTDNPVMGKTCCTYFKEVNKCKRTKLTIISKPRSYRNDIAPYTGPRFSTIL